MVLVSHTHRFVYLKTKKTASTSVEVFFERFCVDDPDHEPVQYCPERIAPEGIVGCRGGRAERRAATWHAHMSAWHAFRALGPRRWFRYFRFATVRNPFEKTVSEFLYRHRNDGGLMAAPLAERRAAFTDWLARTRLPTDRYIYAIAGHPVIHDAIRYETLTQDIRRICGRLGLPASLDRLPALKRAGDRPGEPYPAYYTPATQDRVAKAYAPELRRYGYTFEALTPAAANGAHA